MVIKVWGLDIFATILLKKYLISPFGSFNLAKVGFLCSTNSIYWNLYLWFTFVNVFLQKWTIELLMEDLGFFINIFYWNSINKIVGISEIKANRLSMLVHIQKKLQYFFSNLVFQAQINTKLNNISNIFILSFLPLQANSCLSISIKIRVMAIGWLGQSYILLWRILVLDSFSLDIVLEV